MKHKFLLMALVAVLFLWNTTKAAETEPNNTKAQANTLTLNGSNSGSIGAAADEDWWSITTTGDGKLDVSVTVSNTQYIRCFIYDNDGTTQLNYGETNGGPLIISTDGLATGTYYVRLISYYSGGTPNYTLSNTFTAPAQANDAEPNGTRAQAKVLNLNSSKTGHINYYYNLQRDSSDWYKITTTLDGNINLTIASNNGQYIRCWLYDNNGTKQLNYTETNGTTVQTTNGLAAGTYYIKLASYYANGFIPYTISNAFTAPAEANDAEPNTTKELALTLALNSSTTGHINYYYNNNRDTVDWYKITTNADGRLRLRGTSGNGQYLRWWLYDNDGSTQLNYSETNGTTDMTTDGLTAGTYYIRIQSYYSDGYIPYTIADSLFAPAQANDVEPNGTQAQALSFALNSSTTGHINYYYKLQRDTTDWYKINTPLDGMIGITLTSNNGQYVRLWLLDSNGNQINYVETSSTQTINTDGLSAGAYYVRIQSYYSTGFIPYTLSNSFTSYTYANDASAEPNDGAYQAKTIPANGNVTGHVNFYSNGSRNAVDWWKINYTGSSGALTITLNNEAWKINGANAYHRIWVYKDTNAAQIYYAEPTGNLTINLTTLTQGYYYIKLQSYYTNEHISYQLGCTFTQSTKAKVTLVTADTSAVCDSSNSITIKCTKSKAPYTAQLYRYNLPYRSAVTINNSKNYTFTNLPKGNYYVRVYGDGATGSAFGRFTSIELMPKPTGTSTTNIQATQARLNWTALSCANYFSVQYRKATDANWTTVNTNGNTTFRTITGLTVSTQYYWRVAAADSSNGVTGLSAYTDSLTFTTAASFASSQSSQDAISKTTFADNTLLVYPNPVRSSFRIQFNAKTNAQLSATLKDMNGNIVWSKNTNASALSGTTVDAGKLTSGIYMLQITDTNGNTITKKVVVSK